MSSILIAGSNSFSQFLLKLKERGREDDPAESRARLVSVTNNLIPTRGSEEIIMAERRETSPTALDSTQALLTFKGTSELFPYSSSAQAAYIAGACNKNEVSLENFGALLLDEVNFATRRTLSQRTRVEALLEEAKNFAALPHEDITLILKGYFSLVGFPGQDMRPESLIPRQERYASYVEDILSRNADGSKELG